MEDSSELSISKKLNNGPHYKIIKEVLIGVKEPISYDSLKEIIKRRLDQCIGKIEYNKIIKGQTYEFKGTCFFCKLPIINKVFLITNNHVLQEAIHSFKILNIVINDENIYIDLSNRGIYNNETIDYIIIEIFESDPIENYLKVDNLIFEEDYSKENIYCLQYPLGKKLKYSNGYIEKIKNGKIYHNISTDKGSSGSPIILENSNKVIGIHSAGITEKNKGNICNIGIFLKDLIEDILKNHPNIKNKKKRNIINFLNKDYYYSSFPFHNISNHKVKFTYTVMTKNGIYKDISDGKTAGNIGEQIIGIAIMASSGDFKYRVHISSGWLPFVNGYDLNDYYNGYAGNGRPIDCIQITHINAKYRVSPLYSDFYPWQIGNEIRKGMDGYAGAYGRIIDRFELTSE